MTNDEARAMLGAKVVTNIEKAVVDAIVVVQQHPSPSLYDEALNLVLVKMLATSIVFPRHADKAIDCAEHWGEQLKIIVACSADQHR
jgi:hypothetical protein